MDIKKTMTATFTEEGVKEIIAQHLRDSGFECSKDDVVLHVGKRLEGFGMAEHDVIYFKEAVVQLGEKANGRVL